MRLGAVIVALVLAGPAHAILCTTTAPSVTTSTSTSTSTSSSSSTSSSTSTTTTTTTSLSTSSSTSTTTSTSVTTSTSTSSTSTSTTTSTSTSSSSTSTSTSTTTSTAPTTTTTNPPQAIMGDPTSAPNTTVTVYNTFPPVGTWDATEVRRVMLVPTDGTFNGFRVVLDTAPGSGKSYTFNFRVNGATVGGCTVSDANTTCQDSTVISASAGDRYGIQSVPSGTPASVSPRFYALWAPTTADEFILPSTMYQEVGAARFLVPFAGFTSDANEHHFPSPVAGAIKKLYAWCNTNVAGGATRVFTGRVAGSDGALTCTINAGASTCNDTSNSMSVSADNSIAIHETITGTPGTQDCAAAMVWDPTTADRFLIGGLTGSNSTPASGSKYQALVGFGSARITTTETDVTKQAAPAMTVRGISVSLNASHGAGTSVSYTLRKNGSNTALTTTIADTATANSGTGTISVNADDLLSTEVAVVSGTPGARSSRIGYAATIP